VIAVDSTWLVAAVGILGTGAWLYSKTTSPDSGDDDTGDSSLDDANQPSFVRAGLTNLEWRAAQDLYTTSCGWSPEEEYCPAAQIEDCSDECLEPYLATGLDITQGIHGGQDWGWQGGGTKLRESEGWLNECMCSPIYPMSDGAAIRVKVVKPQKWIKRNKFTIQVHVQGMIRQSSAKKCWKSGSYYNWEALPSGISGGIGVVKASIMPRTGYNATLEWDGETKDYRYNGLQAGNNWRTNYLGQYNIFEFEVTRDAFANMGRGIASLDLSIQFDRDYDSILGEWSETCEFTDTVNITIPNFVFIENSDACEGSCPEWVHGAFEIGYCGKNSCGTRKVDVPQWIKDTWFNQKAAAKYDTYAGSTEGVVGFNAETIFPRNGFAAF